MTAYLKDKPTFTYRYENQKTSEELGINANYHSIKWSPIRVQFLNNLYESEGLGMQCNKSSGARFPGDWSNKPIPKVLIPKRDVKDFCPIVRIY